METTATASRLYTTRTLTDRNVISTSGERLGEIRDLVIDASAGCIAYAVLSYSGGFLNLNRKYFAVPWQAFRIDEAHRDLVLDVTEQQLRESPGFDTDEWPSEPDPTFARSVNEYYGYQYPQPAGQQRGSGTEQQGYGEEQGEVQQAPGPDKGRSGSNW